MKRFEAAFIVIMMLTLGCSAFDPTPIGPAQGIDGDLRDGAASTCHQNMCRLSKAEHIYYTTQGCEYTDDLHVLYGILGVDSLVCPSCGHEYDIMANDHIYRIECPLPTSPDHGFVQGFYKSWPPDDPETRCHDYMVIISQCMLSYYFVYGYGVVNLQQLADFMDVPVEWLGCPVNGAYELWTDDFQRLVVCPTCGSTHSHGFIRNGNQSWPPDPSEYCEICRSRMVSYMSALAVFYARMGVYPDSLDDPEFIEVFGGADHYYCPACGEFYLYYVDPDRKGYWLSCPLQVDPNHGEVIDGNPSW